MRQELAYLTIAIVCGALASPARAQAPCEERDKIVSALAQQFAEQAVGAGITPGGQVLELFASANGSWTLLLSAPGGRSCMIAAGEAWSPPTHQPTRANGTNT